MGRDMLFQLKEMLLVVLPPLNEVREIFVGPNFLYWCRSIACLSRVLARTRKRGGGL